jgi:hypothetical protein
MLLCKLVAKPRLCWLCHLLMRQKLLTLPLSASSP